MRYETLKQKGNNLIIPYPESYGDCWTLIKSDIYRYRGLNDSIIKLLVFIFRPFRSYSKILFWFRLSQYKGVFYPLCRIMYAFICRKYLVQLPLSVKVGYGLYLAHGVNMIVNPGTIIGNNVSLSQFLNIGSNHGKAATVCDNVYIGPHVCLIEDVVIGENSTIGAGSVVTHDVPAGATVAGVPAKVIHYNNKGIYAVRKWNLNFSPFTDNSKDNV